MKKALLLLLTSFMLVGCSNQSKSDQNNNLQEHKQHTFSSVFSYNGTYHYYKCTYPGCSEIYGVEQHTFSNHVCSICGYTETQDQQHTNVQSKPVVAAEKGIYDGTTEELAYPLDLGVEIYGLKNQAPNNENKYHGWYKFENKTEYCCSNYTVLVSTDCFYSIALHTPDGKKTILPQVCYFAQQRICFDVEIPVSGYIIMYYAPYKSYYNASICVKKTADVDKTNAIY